jgi:poly(A) polymerase
MLLRCATGEKNPALGEWWTHFIEVDPDGQETLMTSVKNESGNSASPIKRRRRRKAKATTSTEGEAS